MGSFPNATAVASALDVEVVADVGPVKLDREAGAGSDYVRFHQVRVCFVCFETATRVNLCVLDLYSFAVGTAEVVSVLAWWGASPSNVVVDVVVPGLACQDFFLTPSGNRDPVAHHFDLFEFVLHVVSHKLNVLDVCGRVTSMENGLLVKMDSVHEPNSEKFVLLEATVEVEFVVCVLSDDIGDWDCNERVFREQSFKDGLVVFEGGEEELWVEVEERLACCHLFAARLGQVQCRTRELKEIELVIGRVTEACAGRGSEERAECVDGEWVRHAGEDAFAEIRGHPRLDHDVQAFEPVKEESDHRGSIFTGNDL